LAAVVRRLITYASLLLLLLVAAGFAALPAIVERSQNRVERAASYEASAKALELYQKLLIADLHADSLLWNRDLLERGTRGHVDVPRLIEGNVAVQAFTLVTKVPATINIERNSDRWDVITLLAFFQGWPVATWTSLTERALHQARKLHDYASRSEGKLVLVESREDLSQYLTRRAGSRDLTAGFLGVEGAHALDDDLSNIDVLFDAGIRMMAPTHFFDTKLGGSAHGEGKGGLTDMGREMIRRMEAKRMILDLAHASPKLIDDALAVATRPVVVSHTGVKGTCDNQRNLSDDAIRGIARTGGVIGIGHWETAVCGRDGRAIAKAIRHVVDLVGIEHVGLGSDFDGAVTTPFDTTGLVEIVDGLLQEGFSEGEIRLAMGENVLRLLLENLPVTGS
jgi:microsomal dipeptidase-like Zn-dependent dipeptidase